MEKKNSEIAGNFVQFNKIHALHSFAGNQEESSSEIAALNLTIVHQQQFNKREKAKAIIVIRRFKKSSAHCLGFGRISHCLHCRGHSI